MGNERINIISNKGRRQHNQLNIYKDTTYAYIENIQKLD